MCGIAGLLALDQQPVSSETLRAMCDNMTHRGPDDDGYHVADGIGLGMRRLSIIDPHNGKQPISNEDRSVWVIQNGEIYNYRELQSELESRGHRFRTACDTEVIAHLYEDEGAECVSKLRGMFALAIWDARRRTLLVARDRLGIKPLYYAVWQNTLLFASELKAFTGVPGFERCINWDSLAHVLATMVTPRSESILAGVHKLEPGHMLTAKAGSTPQVHRYWQLVFAPNHRRTLPETTQALRSTLDEAVRLHMRSDVPVGAFLSGGVDSSAVVEAMSRATGRPVKTFSIGFADPAYNELEYARLAAQQFGTEHHELVVEPDALALLDRLSWHLDEPFGDSSAIPTFLVSQLAAQHVKVALSGDGGDELFAGYDKYAVEARERRWDWLPSSLCSLLAHISDRLPDGARGKRFLRHRALRGGARYLDASTLFSSAERMRLLHYDVRAEVSLPRVGHWLSGAQALDIDGYLPLDILTKVDRMSMAHSLEVRVPLLDHHLVELAATIPPALQIYRGERKYAFKTALRGRVPDALLARRKRGFAVPLDRWFRGKLGELARDVLLSETTRARGIFDLAYVNQLLREQALGRPHEHGLWTLISVELWCRRFLDVAAAGVRRAS